MNAGRFKCHGYLNEEIWSSGKAGLSVANGNWSQYGKRQLQFHASALGA
jgi:hypothetical protein